MKDSEEEFLRVQFLVVASMSFTSCFLVLVLYPIARRTITRRKHTEFKFLLLSRFVCLMCSSASAFFDGRNSDLMCKIQASLQVLFEITSVFFVALIATFAFLLIVVRVQARKLRRHRVLICCASFSTGIISWITVISTDSISISGTWCWISEDRVLLRFLCLYMWVFLTFFLIIVMYTLLIMKILKVRRGTGRVDGGTGVLSRRLRVLFLRVAAYPVVFFFCYLIPTTLRFMQTVHVKSSDSFGLRVGMGFVYFEGFINAVVFVAMEQWPCLLMKNKKRPEPVIGILPMSFSTDSVEL